MNHQQVTEARAIFCVTPQLGDSCVNSACHLSICGFLESTWERGRAAGGSCDLSSTAVTTPVIRSSLKTSWKEKSTLRGKPSQALGKADHHTGQEKFSEDWNHTGEGGWAMVR